MSRLSEHYLDITLKLHRYIDLILKVYNGECRNTPEVVVVAGSSEDVAKVVQFVRDEKVELSVRSGGHSYACTSSRVTQHISN